MIWAKILERLYCSTNPNTKIYDANLDNAVIKGMITAQEAEEIKQKYTEV
jgi:hypothetical protein